MPAPPPSGRTDQPPSGWTDQHCHLPPDAADGLVSEALAGGVVRLVNVGTDVASSAVAATVAGGWDEVVSTAGVHPHEASGGLDGLDDLLDRPEVVAVGECGLDYHYLHSPADAQREVFGAQVEMARRRGLPLVIHSRDAWDDTFAVLEAAGVPDRLVFHCFTGGPVEARRCLELGAHLSFSGIVTFPSADELRDAARLCPADRLLVETDSPYLAPVPHRGKPNRPALVAVVGAAVAETRGESPEDVALRTSANAAALYGWDPPA
jgi:TatD DNase family protein